MRSALAEAAYGIKTGKPCAYQSNISAAPPPKPSEFDLANSLVAMMAEQGLPGIAPLELELTGKCAINDSALAFQAVDHVDGGRHSCRIDDFGTGYRQPGLLQEIPAQVVKSTARSSTHLRSKKRSRHAVQGHDWNGLQELGYEVVAEGCGGQSRPGHCLKGPRL